jgi:hypothetical protein
LNLFPLGFSRTTKLRVSHIQEPTYEDPAQPLGWGSVGYQRRKKETDWTEAPLTTTYEGFGLDACIADSTTLTHHVQVPQLTASGIGQSAEDTQRVTTNNPRINSTNRKEFQPRNEIAKLNYSNNCQPIFQ